MLRTSVTLAVALVALMLLAGCTVPVRVEWTTEVEMNTAGFDLFRGESPAGPFDVRVNDELIPASPDPLAGGEYSYVDRTAEAGKRYYYQLQEVELGGAVNSYGPIEVRASVVDWRVAVAGLALVAVVVAVVRRRGLRAGSGMESRA
jgi:hypothetical protein